MRKLFKQSQLIYEDDMSEKIEETLSFLKKITEVKTKKSLFRYFWLQNRLREDVIEPTEKQLLQNYHNMEDGFICLEEKII